MKKFILTMDVGTSTIKAILWDSKGSVIDSYKLASPPLQFSGHRVEQAIDEFDSRIKQVLYHITQSPYFNYVSCLALTTQRNTLIALQDQQPLTPLISWLDSRGRTINGSRLDWLCDRFEHTSKINHLRSLMSWLCEKLTGYAFETASTVPQEWLQTQRDEIKKLNSPQIKAIGSVLSTNCMDDDYRAILPKGLPIILGAGDKDCGLLGGQAFLSEQGVLCCGTAISLGKLVTAKPKQTEACIYVSPSEFDQHYPIETGIADKRILSSVDSKTFVYQFMHCKNILESQGVIINRLVLGGNDELILSRANDLAHALQCQIELIKNSELTSCGLAAIATKAMGNAKTLQQASAIFYPKEATLFDFDSVEAKKWADDYENYVTNCRVD